MRGTLKTYILMAGLTAFFAMCGHLIAGPQGMMMAIVFAAATNLFAYWNSDKVVLKMYRAQQVDAVTAPNYYATVADLAKRANLPMPKVYIIESNQPNAFATGRNPENAAVAATTGLLNMLTRDEVAGVMAHELAHVRNRDTLTMTITATLAGAISSLANFAGMFAYNRRRNGGQQMNPLMVMLFTFLAPLAAMIVQMAISRTREYEADRIGAEISGKPEALASALNKIAHGAAALPNMVAENNPATAHMFIMNPLHLRAVDGLFSTHPRTEERIRRLMDMSGRMNRGGGNTAVPDNFKWLEDGDTFGDAPKSGNPWDRAA